MKRFFVIVLVLAFSGAGAYGIVQAASALSPFSVVNANPTTKLDYADFVSIMLTGVSLILAALGFVVAILAIIGWNSIGERVSSLAQTFLKESMSEGGELHNLVKSEAQSSIYQNMQISMKTGGELHNLVKSEAKAIIYRGVEAVETEFVEAVNEEGKA